MLLQRWLRQYKSKTRKMRTTKRDNDLEKWWTVKGQLRCQNEGGGQKGWGIVIRRERECEQKDHAPAVVLSIRVFLPLSV